MSKLSYKYRIYPNLIQREALDNVFHFCNDLYNSALQHRISSYKILKKSVSYYDQAAELKGISDIFSFAENIHSQTIQYVLKQVDIAYQNFFRRVKQGSKTPGFPRFKPFERFKSILFPQCNLKSGGVKRLPNDKLIIKGIPGEVKAIFHRPFEGRCKTVRILKSSGKYYVILSCDNVPNKPLEKTEKVIGIDLGISTFITTDDGTPFHHPTPYKTSKVRLAYLQQQLDLKKFKSKNRERLKQQISKEHEHIKNVREDFQHKLVNQLIKENDIIILEDLNIKSMLEAKGFEVKKENITEASWGSFAAKLDYKAERADKLIIKVNPRNTSKMCSCCGNIKSGLKLSDRLYQCEACGFAIDRDINAAINIKRLGMSLVTGQTVSEASAFKPR